MGLKSFQMIRRFHRGVLNFPEPVIESLFRQPPRGSWLDRFTIYGTGYSVRSKEALEEIYELLPALMGEKKWNRIGHDYVSKCPSRSFNLSNLGLKLPLFLKREGYKKWFEVAELERLMHLSFHAARSPRSLGLESAAALNDSSRFIFQPSTFLFFSNFRLVEAWRNRYHLRKLKRGKSPILIYRLGDQVLIEDLDVKQFKVLERLKRGLTLGSAIRDLQDPERLSKWMKFWIETEIISAPS